MHYEVIFYNLKKDKNPEAFEEYVRTNKIAFFKSMQTTNKYTLIHNTAAKGGGQVPYDYIAIVEYADKAAWEKESAEAPFGAMIQGWLEWVDDVTMTQAEKLTD